MGKRECADELGYRTDRQGFGLNGSGAGPKDLDVLRFPPGDPDGQSVWGATV